MNENEIGKHVVDTAIAVHRGLGPSLLESVYETVLQAKLRERGLITERQKPISIQFQGIHFDEGFRADLVVDSKVIIELKSVEKVTNAHRKQLLTYLKLANMRLGFLLNFGEAVMKCGIIRMVNNLPE